MADNMIGTKSAIEEFQARVIAAQNLADLVRTTKQRLTINANGFVTLFHGTSDANRASIERDGEFKGNTWFAASKAAVMNHAVPKHGSNIEILSIKVDPRCIEFSTGTGEFYAPSGLRRDGNGVWKEPVEIAMANEPLILAPSFEVGQRFDFKVGDVIVANGVRGCVAKVLDAQLEGMIVADLPGGSVCIAPSFPECFPAFTNEMEVVTEGKYSGSVKEVSEQFVVQDAGRGRLVAHECHRFENLPAVGDSIDLQHRGGKVVFSVAKDKGRGNER
jgi:hypothetical protein